MTIINQTQTAPVSKTNTPKSKTMKTKTPKSKKTSAQKGAEHVASVIEQAKAAVAARIAAVGAETISVEEAKAVVNAAPSKNVVKRVEAQAPKLSPLADAIRNAREFHKRLRTDFIDGIVAIAGQVKAAKAAAKKEGVAFDTLFGNPDDATKFPFTQRWANTIVQVCDSGILKGDMAKLPADLNTLATLASTPTDKRDEVLATYYTLREPVVIEGVLVVDKLNTQAAMRKAKAAVTKDVTPKGSKVKAPKDFNAGAMARKLHASLGDEGLSDLSDAIEALLEEIGVRG